MYRVWGFPICPDYFLSEDRLAAHQFCFTLFIQVVSPNCVSAGVFSFYSPIPSIFVAYGLSFQLLVFEVIYVWDSLSVYV